MPERNAYWLQHLIPAFIHMGVKVLDQAQLFYREYGPVTLPYGGDDLPTPEQRRIVYNPTKEAVINLDLPPLAVKIADNSGFCQPCIQSQVVEKLSALALLR